MKKNVFAFALALLTAASAWAQTFTVDNLNYTVTNETDKTVELTGYETWPEGALDIPATVSYNGINYSVTSIGEMAFVGCYALTQVTIPDGVTSIGNSAFEYCSALTQVTIGNSVESIGSSAFSSCSALTQVAIPENVKSIGSYAFEGTALYNNADNWTNNMLYIDNCLIKAKEELSGNYEITAGTRLIGGGAFSSCRALTQVNIPESVTSIGDGAFSDCYALTAVYYTGDVAGWCGITFSTYSSNPLYYAHNLYINNNLVTELVIPEGVTEIKNYAFYRCSALTQVTIPGSVTSIGDEAFDGCSALTQITWNAINCVDFTIDGPFYDSHSNITTFTFGEQVEHIPGSLCYGMDKLTQVNIPNNVTSIGNHAFSDCSALTQVTLPDGVTNIGSQAFAWCSALTQVTIPDGVTNIGSQAFAWCSALTQVTIPDGVESIGDYAFSDCSALTKITIPKSVESIGGDAFEGCSQLSVYKNLSMAVATKGNSFDKYFTLSYLTALDTLVCPAEELNVITDQELLSCSKQVKSIEVHSGTVTAAGFAYIKRQQNTLAILDITHPARRPGTHRLQGRGRMCRPASNRHTGRSHGNR